MVLLFAALVRELWFHVLSLHFGGPCLSPVFKVDFADMLLILPGSIFAAFFRSTSSLRAREEAARVMSFVLELALSLVFQWERESLSGLTYRHQLC